ncbi:MAG: hypothetical protein ABIQ73_01650 [Acidimicrobiales bacterium]
MMRDVNHDDVGLDMTIYCERLAERLRSRGATHPVAAAVALVARGYRGVDTEPFAAAIGLDARSLRSVEAGAVAFADLPDAVAVAFAEVPSANLFIMADYERRPR